MRCLGLIVLVGVLLSTGSTASAAPGVVQELPGCTTELPANDDDSTDAVALGFTAELFDTSFDAVFVNNNGNVTIGEALSEFTPFDFRETSQAMIAPFFADVDTRGAGSGLVRYGLTTYDGSPAFCVIWDDVGYFAEHDDKLNRFQLIIVDRSDGIDLVFNYDAITWETGDASDGSGGFGGISAVAGYAAGDGDAAHASMLPGSFVNGGLLDTNAATSLAGHSTAGQPAGRYIFALRPGPPTGGRLTGTVTDPNGDPVSGAVVQICPDSGPCLTRLTSGTGIYSASNLAAGNYDVSAFPGPGPSFAPARAGDVGVDAPGTTTTQDLQLGPVPPPPPDGTTITSIGTTDDGLPVAYWDDQLELVTQGCPGATATYQVLLAGQVVRDGSLAESPAGTYRAMIAPLEPNLGDGVITIELDCPAVPDDEVVEFGIYIDPSGVVRDEAGRPVEGATVILSRSADPAGPFFPVPDGSAIMSPANRLNPDASRSDGRFGWDVVAGYYVVAASKAGCVSAKTAVLTIPPPVTDLDLRLDCTPPATSSMTTGGMGSGGIVQLPSSAPKLAKVGKVKLSKGRALVVAIACAPVAKLACAGKVTVALKGKVLGSKRYRNVKPGKTARVKVAFSKRGRSRIAKIKRGKKIKLRVTATVKDAAGTGATAKRTVTLRR
jgi:Carboxypeptidase regulatory-like domain/Nidogen-like